MRFGRKNKIDLGFFLKMDFGNQIPNSISKSMFGGVKFWFWRTVFGTIFFKFNSKFRNLADLLSHLVFQFSNFPRNYFNFYRAYGPIYFFFFKNFASRNYTRKFSFRKFFFNHVELINTVALANIGYLIIHT